MIEAPEGFYDSDGYELQLISREVYEDKGYNDLYGLEMLTFRVNRVGLSGWVHGQIYPSRDDCETEQEWQDGSARAAARAYEWEKETMEKLGLTSEKGTFRFIHLSLGFFAAIRISKVECPSCEGPKQK